MHQFIYTQTFECVCIYIYIIHTDLHTYISYMAICLYVDMYIRKIGHVRRSQAF